MIDWGNSFWSFEETPAVKFHGLKNQGATCYLNSVLQVLFMTREFREAVESSTSDKNIDRHLQTLFSDLKKGPGSTVNVTKALGIQRVCEQRDSAEYFEKILSLTSHDASKIFHGVLTHLNRCSGCGIENDTDGPFWSLPLALVDSNNEGYSVAEGVEAFFKTSEITGENQMYCEQCDDKADATIKCVIKTHPDVLTLLLKRFDFDYRYMRYVKINCGVDVPRNLHIPENQLYELYGVVEHVGSLRGGHYTSTIKPQDDDTWYKFNDTTVTKLKRDLFQEDHITNSNSAYLLFYRKKKYPVNQGVGTVISPGGLQIKAGQKVQRKEKQTAEEDNPEVPEEEEGGGTADMPRVGSIDVEQMISQESLARGEGYVVRQEEEKDRTERTGDITGDQEPNEVRNHDDQRNVTKQGKNKDLKEHRQERKRKPVTQKSGEDQDSETPDQPKRPKEDQTYRVEGNKKDERSDLGAEREQDEGNQQLDRRGENKDKEENGPLPDLDNAECRDNVGHGNAGQSVSNEDQSVCVSNTNNNVSMNSQVEKETEDEQPKRGDDEQVDLRKSSDFDDAECRDNVRHGNVGQSMSTEDQPVCVSNTNNNVSRNSQVEKKMENERQRRLDQTQKEGKQMRNEPESADDKRSVQAQRPEEYLVQSKMVESKRSKNSEEKEEKKKEETPQVSSVRSAETVEMISKNMRPREDEEEERSVNPQPQAETENTETGSAESEAFRFIETEIRTRSGSERNRKEIQIKTEEETSDGTVKKGKSKVEESPEFKKKKVGLKGSKSTKEDKEPKKTGWKKKMGKSKSKVEESPELQQEKKPKEKNKVSCLFPCLRPKTLD